MKINKALLGPINETLKTSIGLQIATFVMNLIVLIGASFLMNFVLKANYCLEENDNLVEMDSFYSIIFKVIASAGICLSLFNMATIIAGWVLTNQAKIDFEQLLELQKQHAITKSVGGQNKSAQKSAQKLAGMLFGRKHRRRY